MAVFNNILAGAAGQAGGAAAGYQIERSVRFNDDDSASLTRTFSTSGPRTWTWSGWVKRCLLGANQALFAAGSYSIFGFNSTDNLRFETTSNATNAVTAQVFRDLSAWYHIVLAADNSAATSDRLRIYVNGNRADLAVAVGLGAGPHINTNIEHSICKHSTIRYFDGYLADVHFIDGQALAATDFGKFDDNGVWQPIAYAGTYGTNGFHLDFSDNSTVAALGTDTSGNGNDWTVNNLSVNEANYANGTTNAVNGVIPNGGDPYWIDFLPTDADLDYDTGTTGMQLVHDGSTTTNVYWVGSQYSAGNVLRARFDLRDYPTITSLRVYGGFSTAYVNYDYQLLDSSKTPISGTSGTFGAVGWHSLTILGSPRYLEISTTSGNSRRHRLYAIEVNGTVLVSGNPANNDSFFDSPTNGTQTDTGAGGEVSGNYATWNPLTKTSVHTLSNGNLDVTTTDHANLVATIFLSSGKWYWEVNSDGYVGITGANGVGFTGSISSSGSDSYGYWYSNGYIYSGVGGSISGGASFSYSDIIGVALDIDGNNVKFYKNGVLQHSITLNESGWEDLRGGVFPSINGGNTGTKNFTLNAGQRPFAYSAPSGYKALCTANLDDPTIADGSDYMDVVTYTGNGTSQTISGLEFSPDLVWIKDRTSTGSHVLQDTVRGTDSYLMSNETAAENNSTNYVTSFNADGFSIGNGNRVNNGSRNYVAWTWDAGSTFTPTVSGFTSPSGRKNTSAGFSVVKVTGNNTVSSFDHGLNVAPAFIISKNLDNAYNWGVYHEAVEAAPTKKFLNLNNTNAVASKSLNIYRVVSNSLVEVDSYAETGSNGDYIYYCFAPVEGFSAFGSYEGNGSTDGPFIYTGFRPRWVMYKSIDTTKNWQIQDTERDSDNPVLQRLSADLSDAEYTGTSTSDTFDALSNGFKIRGSNNGINQSSTTYIYAAFAENPFKIARAR